MKRRRLILKLGLAALALAVCELALRLFGYEPHTGFRNLICKERIERPLPGVPYLFKPMAEFREQWAGNPDGYFDPPDNSIRYRVNNFGFRGADMTLERNPKVRVLFLGDSFCWGMGVKDEDHFLAVMGRKLADVDGRERVELYNLGMPGFNLRQEVALSAEALKRFRPDVCVIWFFLNDIGTGNDGLGTISRLGGDDFLPGLRGFCFLLDLVVTPFDRMLGRRKLISEYTAAYRDPQSIQRMSKLLEAFAALCRSCDARPVLCVHPVLHELDDDYPFEEIHRKVLAAATEHGIVSIDLFPYLRGMEAPRLWVHPSDQHPNHVAHRSVAEGLVGDDRWVGVLMAAAVDWEARRAARRRGTEKND